MIYLKVDFMEKEYFREVNLFGLRCSEQFILTYRRNEQFEVTAEKKERKFHRKRFSKKRKVDGNEVI